MGPRRLQASAGLLATGIGVHLGPRHAIFPRFFRSLTSQTGALVLVAQCVFFVRSACRDDAGNNETRPAQADIGVVLLVDPETVKTWRTQAAVFAGAIPSPGSRTAPKKFCPHVLVYSIVESLPADQRRDIARRAFGSRGNLAAGSGLVGGAARLRVFGRGGLILLSHRSAGTADNRSGLDGSPSGFPPPPPPPPTPPPSGFTLSFAAASSFGSPAARCHRM